ncbi:MAG: hypothetical protein IJW21_07270 [Clostridia bacterium]|nr:hypothetical protein [Clostridia bacterium]
MFYDERIEYERGRISRTCIIISVIFALIYGALNLANILTGIEAPGLRHFFHLGLEAVIAVSGTLCLVIGFFRNIAIKDERTKTERNLFYNKAALVHLCVTLTAWSLIMPFSLAYPLPRINFYALPYDYGISLLFFPIVSYCVYSFKSSEIYFNYSILESKHYYKGVLRNIGKFGGYMALLLVISFTCLSFIILAQIRTIAPEALLSYVSSIFLAHVIAFAVSSVLYLFLSMLEKASYDNETRLVSKATVVSFLVAACLTLVVYIVAFFAVIWINDLHINGSLLEGTRITVGQAVTAINYSLSLVQSFVFLAFILSITYFCYEYRRVKKNRLLSGSVITILTIKSLYQILPTFFNLAQRISVKLFANPQAGIYSYELEKGIEEFHMYLTYFINFAEILALALIITALIKDGTLSKESYASLAIIAVLFGVMVFLSTQLGAVAFSQARAIFSGVIYIYCAITVAILGSKKFDAND